MGLYSVRTPGGSNSAVLPTMVLGWQQTSASRTIVHECLDGSIALILRPASMRTGTLMLFFETRSAAFQAHDAHLVAGTWEFADDDNPETHLIYVVPEGAQLRLYNDEMRRRWTLEVPFREVYR